MKREKNLNEPAIATKLRQLMNKTGVNKSGLARIAGITPQAAGRWFTKGTMSKESALRLSEAFGVSLAWLLSEDTEAEEEPESHPLTLNEQDRELLNLFNRLPESQREEQINSLRQLVDNYDKLFGELLKTRNIKDIINEKNKN